MARKFFFFDIDGTLLDFEKKLPDSTIEAVARLKQAGHSVAISTGRGPFMFQKIREELNIDSFVSYNGQFVVYEDKVIYENPIKIEALEDLVQAAKNANFPLVFMSDDEMRANTKDHPYIHESLASLQLTHPEYEPEYYREKMIYQALLFCKEGEEEQFNQREDIKFVRWHDLSTDVLPNGGSKAEGIKKMIEMAGFRRDEVVAFGDGLNDIEMIEYAGTGVAMGNAVEDVKQLADFITKPVDDDGIYHAVKQLGFL